MVHVIKANGELEQYSEEKVINSIKRAGIPPYMQAKVLAHVNSKTYENIPSNEIYQHIIEFLGKSEFPYTRSTYSLKQAIMELGPTGYPFEDFLAEILTSLGYTVKVRQIVMGKCVSHEVDVIAEKNGVVAMIEAKFHNAVGTRSDVRVPMYTKSRFDDIKEKHGITEAWVMTNTKVTSDAVAFAHCVGMKVISWSYPSEGSLRDLIEQSRLHPITMLTTLSLPQKAQLLEQHIIMCKAIQKNPGVLSLLGLNSEEKERVLGEVDFICKQEKPA